MVRKIVIATVAAAALVTGAGAAAVAASSGAGASGGSPSAQRESEVRHEPEARGRIAEDEREAGEDLVREVEAEEVGDVSGNRGPSESSGPVSTSSAVQGRDAQYGGHDEPNHDVGDDRGHDG